MKKQTSIEWFMELFNKLTIHYLQDNDDMTYTQYELKISQIIEQAKAMHKEEIMTAHGDVRDYLLDDGSWERITNKEYYDETFTHETK